MGSKDDATIDATAALASDAPVRPAERSEPDYGQLITIERTHYVLGEEIARGGMGRVITARDRRIGRMVAIKELLPKNRHRVARFEREARITARLQHPGIIHVYEAGTWPGGDPFYAMNHVAGRPLSEVIAERATLAERLGLLRNVIAVADALTYAHAQNVIHRDLKPSNVLVGEYGETVVIDWGLARDLSNRDALEERETEVRPDATGVIGTPSYMPPEQARGEPADQRSDVYSLGALLHHVLTGAPPYTGGSGAQVMNAVLAGDRRHVREIDPDVPVDLASIVDKAMAGDPAQRYPHAGELAADLKRFETGQLVAARHYTMLQRVGRFVRKHAIAVGTTLAIVTLGGFGVARIISEQHTATEHAERAERRFEDVRKLANSLLFEVDAAIRDISGTTKARELVVQRALTYLDKLAAERSDDPDLERELALGYIKIGDVFNNGYDPNLGKPEEGERAYRKAEEVIARARETWPDDRRFLALEARRVLGTGVFALANRDRERTRKLMSEGLVLAREAGDAFDDRVMLIRAQLSLSYVDLDDRRFTEVERHNVDAQAVIDGWPDQQSAQVRYWREVVLDQRAELLTRFGDPDRALELSQQAVALGDALFASDPHNQAYQNQAIKSRMVAGMALAGFGDGHLWLPGTGDLVAAERVYAEATRASEVAMVDPDDARSIIRLAIRISDEALVRELRSAAEALPLYERALATFERVATDFRKSGFVRENEMLPRCAIATTLAGLGRTADARAAAKVGLEMASFDPFALASCEFRIGRMEVLLGDRAAAIARFESVLRALGPLDEPSATIGIAETLDELARLRPADACALRRRALQTWRAKPIATPFGARFEVRLTARLAACP